MGAGEAHPAIACDPPSEAIKAARALTDAMARAGTCASAMVVAPELGTALPADAVSSPELAERCGVR
jgi:hypothetical protein